MHLLLIKAARIVLLQTNTGFCSRALPRHVVEADSGFWLFDVAIVIPSLITWINRDTGSSLLERAIKNAAWVQGAKVEQCRRKACSKF